MSQLTTSNLPKHLKPVRSFKARKRQEFEAIAQAVEAFGTASAYTPAYAEFRALRCLVEGMRERLSVEQWGR